MEPKDFNSFFENEFQLLNEVNEVLDKKEPLDGETLLKELKKIRRSLRIPSKTSLPNS
ncbi:hypothetical protein LEP1GSC161_0385 [Leptospira santarosai str. CBC1416]|uniref:Uncharacterized protein n=1 Tax=Leptospira santarosai str. CBC1416 TaxID=1193059 RepID=M6W5Y9_9LEPT|nr:hypothetical protein LEP1GSC161_0385 [Leptospira santarosai str. CBC1416]